MVERDRHNSARAVVQSIGNRINHPALNGACPRGAGRRPPHLRRAKGKAVATHGMQLEQPRQGRHDLAHGESHGIEIPSEA